MTNVESQPAPPIELGLDRRERGDSFETLSHVYSAGRPSYPKEFIESLIRPVTALPDTHVLEVGAGTGQATVRLAELFSRVTAIEPGYNLAQQTEQRLSDRSNVDVHQSYFENWEGPGPYDCVFSASAFHWTDPTRSYSLAKNLLKPGGKMAFVTYSELVGDDVWEQRCADIRKMFTAHAPHHKGPRFGTRTAAEISTGLKGYAESIGQALEFVEFGKPLEAANVPVSEMFDPVKVQLELQLRHYDADRFVAALESYGAFRRMNEDARIALKEAVRTYVEAECQNSIERPFALVGLAANRRP
ncbi:class I SAM-dependent methyltransferase [Streptomyces luteolus]|uniref:Class I SAM-dependent methyltransferase n=1 Tax=Streptomyces luteolus TaxID=3043615 RepID=A0ABT6SXU5_9ACTN|nr:class I SAM-dependent methyltransferase [Streptomyces sp. B-S-A12]MDI3420435.1 class I SAM-dependent methyltransferase [Streptomyces sp. B-S-A12]